MRIATLDLTPELFVEFAKACTAGEPRRFIVRQNALPDDAKVIDVEDWRECVDYVLFGPSIIRLTIESESFAEVSEGSDPPALPLVVFETVYDNLASPTIALIDKKMGIMADDSDEQAERNWLTEADKVADFVGRDRFLWPACMSFSEAIIDELKRRDRGAEEDGNSHT